ncbi:MAG TPA: YkgJ family cysteine cluster protein [Polyangiaceae bacterium]|jgi:Fe-S-cluster containining protein|nr:YkgJ family cysteine cluster protein [Polyangiaceae bacterium]
MGPRRSLPLYGGVDAGLRPDAREQVRNVLDAGLDPVEVAARVGANVDAFVAHWTATDESGDRKPACARGCSHCCHQRVEVTAPEVFLLARALREAPDAARNARIVATATAVEGLDGRAYHARQVRCALLGEDGACSAYAARPVACRRHHSTDASVCAAVHRDPALDVLIPMAASLKWNVSGLVLGWLEGLSHAGRPPHHYELHAALRIALDDPGAQARFLAGEDPLRDARSRDAAELPLHLGTAGQDPAT